MECLHKIKKFQVKLLLMRNLYDYILSYSKLSFIYITFFNYVIIYEHDFKKFWGHNSCKSCIEFLISDYIFSFSFTILNIELF